MTQEISFKNVNIRRPLVNMPPFKYIVLLLSIYALQVAHCQNHEAYTGVDQEPMYPEANNYDYQANTVDYYVLDYGNDLADRSSNIHRARLNQRLYVQCPNVTVRPLLILNRFEFAGTNSPFFLRSSVSKRFSLTSQWYTSLGNWCHCPSSSQTATMWSTMTTRRL